MTPIKEQFIPKGTPARPGYAMQPEYITIHNTANASKGAGAESHGLYMTQNGGQNAQVSYHYVVDDNVIIRLLPDTENAWHAGDGANGTGNRKSLAIEICENPESDLLAATDNAAELTARLMKDWGIGTDHVVQHYFWSGKNCPRRIRAGEPYTWDAFLARVQGFYTALTLPKEEPEKQDPPAALYAVQTGAFLVKENAQNYQKALAKKGIESFITTRGEYFRVQTGAFANKDNADRYAQKLFAMGIEAIVVKKEACV